MQPATEGDVAALSSDGGNGCGAGCVGAIAGGVVPLIACILWLSGAFGPRCPSPWRARRGGGPPKPNASKATTTATIGDVRIEVNEVSSQASAMSE